MQKPAEVKPPPCRQCHGRLVVKVAGQEKTCPLCRGGTVKGGYMTKG